MARAFAILLPPSEAKSPCGSGPPGQPGTGALPVLDDRRAEVLRALDLKGAGVAAEPIRPALERYDGVLYRELDPGTLSGPARRRLRRTTLIAFAHPAGYRVEPAASSFDADPAVVVMRHPG